MRGLGGLVQWPVQRPFGEIKQPGIFHQGQHAQVVGQGFSQANHQHPLIAQQSCQPLLNGAARRRIEIDRNVAAEHHVTVLQGPIVRGGQQVQLVKSHHLAHGLGQLPALGCAGEVALAHLLRYASERKIGIQGCAGTGQGVAVDIAAQHRKPAGRMVTVFLPQRQGDGIRLLPCRASGRQNADGPSPLAARQQARCQVLHQPIDLCRLAEKIGFVDGQQVHQLLQFAGTALH